MTPQTTTVSDEQLAQQAQAGCATSFEALVYRYEARIYRFVANSCGDAEDAREVTQDIFVAAHRHLETFDCSRSWPTWLFAIARRKCVDFFRGKRGAANEPVTEGVDQNDPATLLTQQESASDLWQRARAILPELQFQALWLRYAEDMDVAEISEVLRRTQTHVKVLLFRARLKLERELIAEQQAVVNTGLTENVKSNLPLTPLARTKLRGVI